MIYLALALNLTLLVTIGAFLWFFLENAKAQRGRDDKAEHERRDLYLKLVTVAEQAERERNEILQAASEERQVLLERIQRPELVPTGGAPDPSTEPLHVATDDDNGQWQAAYGITVEGG